MWLWALHVGTEPNKSKLELVLHEIMTGYPIYHWFGGFEMLNACAVPLI